MHWNKDRGMSQLKGTMVKQFRAGNSNRPTNPTLCCALESKIKLWVDLRELLDQLTPRLF